jgi:large subunit ribosomal protein L16
MALMPKRVKFRKFQKGRNRGNATRGNTVAYGEFGLQALGHGRITAQQIEAGRIAAQHHMGREGKVYVRMFPHRSVTSKPLETRMGKGKGEPETWVAVVKPGTMMYEVGHVTEELAREAFARVSNKLPVKCRMVHRRHGL